MVGVILASFRATLAGGSIIRPARRGLGVCRAGLRGAVAREAAQRLGAATYSARKWLAARRPVYRWKRLGAGYKASAAGAASGGGGPLDSGMAAFFSQIGSRKADLPNRVNHFGLRAPQSKAQSHCPLTAIVPSSLSAASHPRTAAPLLQLQAGAFGLDLPLQL